MVEAGVYRLKMARHPEPVDVAFPPRDEAELLQTFVDYEDAPREDILGSVVTVLDVRTRVSDLYSNPNNQIKEQRRLAIETVQGAPGRRADHQCRVRHARHRRVRPPVHPPGGATGNRQPVRLAVHLPAGCPLDPVEQGARRQRKTTVLLLRVGEERQGVVGPYQPGLVGEQSMGLSVRFMGIDRSAISSHLISLYCSLAVLTDDALAVLDDVEVEKFHDYAFKYDQ
ncbi:MAG TPA: hypothetical protein VII19_03720 [Acidimicrobiales bacterium]